MYETIPFLGMKPDVSRLKKSVLLKFPGVCGILASAIAFCCIFLAIASYHEFEWTSNALSDLGVVPGFTMNVFNFGLISSGVLCLIFTLGLYVFFSRNTLGKIGVMLFGLACLALVAIGLFPENVHPNHFVASVAFFVCLPLALLVLVPALWQMRRASFSLFTLVVALVAAFPWLLLLVQRYVEGVAVPEMISAVAGATWAVVFAVKLFKGSE
jgi:hypothetical membrane protein